MLFLLIVTVIIGDFNLKLENMVDADPSLMDRPLDNERASDLASKIIDNPTLVQTDQGLCVTVDSTKEEFEATTDKSQFTYEIQGGNHRKIAYGMVKKLFFCLRISLEYFIIVYIQSIN